MKSLEERLAFLEGMAIDRRLEKLETIYSDLSGVITKVEILEQKINELEKDLKNSISLQNKFIGILIIASQIFSAILYVIIRRIFE